MDTLGVIAKTGNTVNLMEIIVNKAYEFGNPFKYNICKADLMLFNNIEDDALLNKNPFWISSKALNFQVIFTENETSYFE